MPSLVLLNILYEISFRPKADTPFSSKGSFYGSTPDYGAAHFAITIRNLKSLINKQITFPGTCYETAGLFFLYTYSASCTYEPSV